MNVRRLTLDEARRIAVRAQMLDADRPHDLPTVVDRLTFLQLDPTAVVAPSADLVAWSRLGGAIRPADLQQAVEVDRTLFEHRAQPTVTEPLLAMVRPMARPRALPRRDGRLAPRERTAPRVARRQRRVSPPACSTSCATSGPLASRDIPDTSAVPWASSGWTNDRNVTQMLEFLAARARSPSPAAAAGSACGTSPSGCTRPERAGGARRRGAPDPRRATGCGRWALPARGRWATPAFPRGRGHVGPVAGRPGRDSRGFEGRTALLSPFDRLIHDRVRAQELFGFDYTLEMYKPKAEAAVGVLRPARAARRPAGRQGRRRRRPRGVGPPGARSARGRSVHGRDARRRGSGA